MVEYCIEYNNFKELKKREPELAKELLEKVGDGNWQDDLIYKFACVEDFAYYQLTEGCYANAMTQDFDDVPNPLDYVDLTKLGKALVDSWDEDRYFLASDGEILSTDCGWYQKGGETIDQIC